MHERLSWPQPPIWPEDLPLIRALLTEDEYVELCQRLGHVVPDGSLQDNEIVLFKRSKIELRKRLMGPLIHKQGWGKPMA